MKKIQGITVVECNAYLKNGKLGLGTNSKEEMHFWPQVYIQVL